MLTRYLRAAAMGAVAVGVLGGLLPTGHASAASLATAPTVAAAATACEPSWGRVPGEQRVGAYCRLGSAGWITATITCVRESNFKEYTLKGKRKNSDMGSDRVLFMSFASCHGVDAYVTGGYVLG